MHSLLIRIRLLLTIGIILFPVRYFGKQLMTYLRRAGNTLQDHIQQARQHIGEEDAQESPEEEIAGKEPEEILLEIEEIRTISTTPDIAETNEKSLRDPNPVSESLLVSAEETETEEKNTIPPEKLAQQLDDIKYAALTYKERGNLDEYEKKLIEGIALVGDNEEFLSMLTDHYFEARQYVKASTLLKKLIQLKPDHHKALWQLGQIYMHDKDLDTARLLFEKAREFKDEHPKYLISLIELYYELGELREAISIVEKLIKLRPKNIDYLLTLAKLYEEVNQPTKANDYYMKVLEINPLNDEAKKAIKRLL